jgi:glyoxylase-like metal-dependent hydrolase (beta-lactamase superfamily II)
MKQLLPSLYTLGGMLVGRVYLIQDTDGLTLIDAAIPPSGGRILKAIQTLGHSISDLKRIIITHAHPDHVGGLPTLHQAAPQAQIICHPLEKPVIEGQIEIPRAPLESLSRLSRMMLPPPTRLPSVPVSRTVEEGEVLSEVLGGLHVLWTPGHAPGHISLWQPDLGLLFCGDTMFHLIGITLPIRAFTVDMAQNIRSIQRQAALRPRMICFGHGPAITHNAAETLSHYAARFA